MPLIPLIGHFPGKLAMKPSRAQANRVFTNNLLMERFASWSTTSLSMVFSSPVCIRISPSTIVVSTSARVAE